MITVQTVCDFLNTIAPFETKCSWDNCGLLVGRGENEVKKIGFALDLTDETLKNAKNAGAKLIVTHHPVIFRPQKDFLSGNAAFEAAVSGISVISVHTCFDCADGGVNDVLCGLLGIKNAVGVPSEECAVPMARIGDINETSPRALASFVSDRLDAAVRLVDGGKPIKKAAVCGGAGMAFIDDVLSAGADAYITGDISHHEMLEAAEKGLTVIAAGHFETEYPAMETLRQLTQNEFPQLDCVLLRQSSPAVYINKD